MKAVAVSDTNIFIDLVEIGLLDAFFALPWEIHTTDMIIHELKVAEQKVRVEEYCSNGRLHVKEYTMKEMQTLIKFHAAQRQAARASIQDCSVWLFAMENEYTLLTGDARLRNAVAKMKVDVHGIFYVIDKLVEMQLLSKENAADKLDKLKLLNPRLPLSEIDKRLKNWRGSEKRESL